MPLDSTIPQEVDVKARQAGGRKLEADSLLWKTLFPVDHLRIDGRVPVDKSAQYLTQSRLNSSRELIAVVFFPDSEASATSFDLLSKYLIGKGCVLLVYFFESDTDKESPPRRHGLIFPWGHRPKEHHPGRELYIIPLLASEPLPEFIELMDDLQLPKIRKHNYMIGVWVLTMGKLAPPLNVPISTPPVLPPTLISTISPSAVAADVSHQIPQQQPPLPLTPQLPSASPAPSTPAPQNLPFNLKEIVSLTPEEIHLMLHRLSTNGQIAIAPVAAQQPAAPVTMPSTMPSVVPPAAAPHQSWLGFPPLPPTYPPVAGQQPAAPHAPYVPPPYEQYGTGAPPPPLPPLAGHQYDTFNRGGERGHRGRGSARGRGRGYQHQQSDRQRDSGWAGRGRGRGRGGQSGASSDRQWGSSQRWNQ